MSVYFSKGISEDILKNLLALGIIQYFLQKTTF